LSPLFHLTSRLARLMFLGTISVFGLSGQRAQAGEPPVYLNTKTLSVSIRGAKPIKVSAKASVSPEEFCNRLAEQFTAPKHGPFGASSFKNIDCSGTVVTGENGDAWILEINALDDNLRLELSYQPKSTDTGIVQASLEIPMYVPMSKPTIQMALMDLLEKSPIFASIPGRLILDQKAHIMVPLRCGVTSDKLPSEVVVFRLAWSPEMNLWQPSIVGTGTLTTTAGCPAWSIELTDHSDLKDVKELKDQRLYIHSKDGRGLANHFSKHILGLAPSPLSAYVGLRYAYPLLVDKQTGLMTHTKFYSLVAEFRGGLVRGLRAYVDYLPPAHGKVPETNEKTSLKFLRYVLGYSFGFTIKYLPLRFEFVPKLGVWYMLSRLPLNASGGSPAQVLPFDLVYQPAISADFGVEYDFLHLTVLRAWFNPGIGYAVPGAKNQNYVSSTRTGIDTFWSPLRGLDTSHIEFSLIGSAFTETTHFKRLDTPSSGEPYIGEFTYRQNYLSIGFALAW
jgi:hypothetical protein